MFHSWNNEESGQTATTTILNKKITPVSTYENTECCLNKACNELLITSHGNIQEDESSLTQAWGQDKNHFWQCYKQAAVTLAVDYLQQDDMKPDIFSLYALLADCRCIIADNLNQRQGIGSDFIGIARPNAMRNMRDKRDTTYLFPDRGPYASFYPTLNNLFSKISHDSSPIYITVDEYPVTIINRDDEHMSITHCDENDISFDILSGKIADSYQRYLSATDTNSILRATGELVYYFSIAMPLIRGSAACVEMMSQALLLHKGLQLQYQDKDGIIPDLRAFYSRDANEFVTIYSQNHIKSDYRMNEVHTGLFERRALINKIMRKNESLASEMKKSDKDMPACIQKQRVLLATVNYLNDLINLDKLNEILRNNPEFSAKRVVRSSDTSNLVEMALELKAEQSRTGKFIGSNTKLTRKSTL